MTKTGWQWQNIGSCIHACIVFSEYTMIKKQKKIILVYISDQKLKGHDNIKSHRPSWQFQEILCSEWPYKLWSFIRVSHTGTDQGFGWNRGSLLPHFQLLIDGQNYHLPLDGAINHKCG